MDNSRNHYTIKKGELLLLFILLIIGGGLIFAVGVRIGKNILQNDCQAILEENQKKIEELETKKTTSTEPVVEEAKTSDTTEETNTETKNSEVSVSYTHLTLPTKRIV